MKNFSSLKEEICLECSLTEADDPNSSRRSKINPHDFFKSCRTARDVYSAHGHLAYWYFVYAGVYLDHGRNSKLPMDKQIEERKKFFNLDEKITQTILRVFPAKNPDMDCVSRALEKTVNTDPSDISLSDDPLYRSHNRIGKSYGSIIPPLGISKNAPIDFMEIWKEVPGNTALMREISAQAKLDKERYDNYIGIPKQLQRSAEANPYNHNIIYDKDLFRHILQTMANSDEVYETNTLRDPMLQIGMMGDPSGSTKYAKMGRIKYSKSSYGNHIFPIRGQWESGYGGDPDRITLNYIKYLFNDGPNGIQGLARTFGHELRHRAFDIIFDNKDLYDEMPPELKKGGRWWGGWGGYYSRDPSVNGPSMSGITPEHAMLYCQDQKDPLNTKAAKFVTYYDQEKYPPAYWRELYARVGEGVNRWLAQFAKKPTRRPTTGIPPRIVIPDSSPEEVKRKAEQYILDLRKRHLFPELQTNPVVREMYNRIEKYDAEHGFGAHPSKDGRDQIIYSIINRLDYHRGSVTMFWSPKVDVLRWHGTRRQQQAYDSIKRLFRKWELEVSMKGNWNKAKLYPTQILRILDSSNIKKLVKERYDKADESDKDIAQLKIEDVDKIYNGLNEAIARYDELERQIKKVHPKGWAYFSYEPIQTYLRRNPDYDPYNPTGEPTPPVSAPKPVAPTPTTPVTPATPATPISSGRGTPATAPPEEKKNPWENIFISSRKRRTGPRQPSSAPPTTIERPVDKKLIEKIRDIIDSIRKEKPYLGDRALIAGAVVAVVAGGFFAFRKYLFDRKTQRVASTVLRDPKSRDMIQDLRKRERRRVLELLKDKNFRERVLAEV
tara:strand:+ start:231 stop:2735 length:2505 start_codon:yes stop_codon:yes gene_type:complete